MGKESGPPGEVKDEESGKDSAAIKEDPMEDNDGAAIKQDPKEDNDGAEKRKKEKSDYPSPVKEEESVCHTSNALCNA